MIAWVGGSSGSDRCMGKPEATDAIDPALAPGGQRKKVSPLGGFS